MTFARTLALCAAGTMCATQGLDAQGFSQYRNFTLGSDVAAVSALAGVASSEAKVVRFYDNQLFRVAVDYGRDRTEGMTNADMIEAVSAVYGTPLSPKSRPAGRPAARPETDSGSPLAQWGDAEHAVGLYHTSSYGSVFRLIVTETRLDGLARKADEQARRLDVQEAPGREIARQQTERDSERAAAAKARAANKGAFRP